VRWHTSGHPDYDAEAWALFVADKVEPEKRARWPALAAVAERAERSLEAAALYYLDLRLEEAVATGIAVHPLATLARNALLRRAGGPHRRPR
jgi:HD superfamily phosphohydrolase YqeK